MIKFFFYLILIFLLIPMNNYAQSIESLRQEIEQIIYSKKSVVGLAIQGTNEQDTLSINGNMRMPMQSVFKFHIGLAMLEEIDKGNYSLDQKVEILKSELLPGLWSPIRERYPEGVTLSIAEIMQYTITLSDNVGCDILIRLLGEPQTVEDYFVKKSFKNISIKINEETMQNNWDQQFQNWITPIESNRILQTFYENKDHLLSEQSYDFIWKTMQMTETGKLRLRGQLPKETVVAHKTGWSGKNATTGITAAVNDIGIVFLPNGEYFIISVYLTESSENIETNEKIISDIAKASWDFFINRK